MPVLLAKEVSRRGHGMHVSCWCSTHVCAVQIRTQIAQEMVQDLGNIAEENSLLMRETLFLAFNLDNVVDHPLNQEEGTPPSDS